MEAGGAPSGRLSERMEAWGDLPTRGNQDTDAQFCRHPLPLPLAPPKKCLLGQGLHGPESPPCPATPREPTPHRGVCYLTTDTDIQKEPPCAPHPESRHPRPGARCSRAGGSRAAERPGRAEVR